jgi:transcriptional regulator with XRE-family HTH domain
MNIIGQNVKTIRENKGWTQEQLTAKCNLISWEVTRSTIAKIESRVRRVTDIEVRYLALALEKDITTLFAESILKQTDS